MNDGVAEAAKLFPRFQCGHHYLLLPVLFFPDLAVVVKHVPGRSRCGPNTDTYQRPSELVTTAENSSISQPGATRGTTFMDTNPGCKRKILFYYRPQRAPSLSPSAIGTLLGLDRVVRSVSPTWTTCCTSLQNQLHSQVEIYKGSTGSFQKWTGTSVTSSLGL